MKNMVKRGEPAGLAFFHHRNYDLDVTFILFNNSVYHFVEFGDVTCEVDYTSHSDTYGKTLDKDSGYRYPYIAIYIPHRKSKYPVCYGK